MAEHCEPRPQNQEVYTVTTHPIDGSVYPPAPPTSRSVGRWRLMATHIAEAPTRSALERATSVVVVLWQWEDT